jgi:integrase
MAITYKCVIRASKVLKSGRNTIFLRLTVNRQQVYLDLGLDVRAKDWNDAGSIPKPNWVRAAEPQAELYNITIRKYMLRAQKLALDQPDMASAAEFRDRLSGKLADKAETSDFLAYFADDVARRLKHGNPRTAERYQNRLHKLKRFCGWVEATPTTPEVLPAPLLMSQLTPRFVRDYQTYLEQLGNRGQTVPKELGALNTIVKLAVADGLMRHEQNPFLHIRISMPKAKKEYLRIDELRRFQALELPAEKLHKWYLVSRTAWLLGFYLYGSRVGDLLMLRRRHVLTDRIRWQEQKTGKWKEVPLMPELRQVLDLFLHGIDEEDFVLPVLDARQWYFRYPKELCLDDLEKRPEFRQHLVAIYKATESATTQLNKYLKKVAALAGIARNVTMHTARHSFITLSIKGGYGIRQLQGLANHHSITETEQYAHDLEQEEGWHKGMQAYDGVHKLIAESYQGHTPPQHTEQNEVQPEPDNMRISYKNTA